MIYVKRDLWLSVGYCVGSTIGAFAGGYAALWMFPQSDKPGILFGGILGAVVMVVIWYLIRGHKDRRGS